MLLGCKVVVHQGKNSYSALAVSIDDEAHLVVQDEAGKQYTLSSAEISIRLEV
jgi:BirA family biotin operon repressor/biotin-[acetyl-CoA-carboxylase] ligase